MKRLLAALTIVTMMSATAAIAKPERQTKPTDTWVCPSDPITCWITKHSEFDCRHDPLKCWLGVYRDPNSTAKRSSDQGW